MNVYALEFITYVVMVLIGSVSPIKTELQP